MNYKESLPIFKHYQDSEIVTTTTNALDKFRKGEFSMYTLLKILFFGGLAVAFAIYALPVALIMLGQITGIILSLILIGATIIMSPLIVKGIRRFTRKMHEAMIKHDPFAELYDQLRKMVERQNSFQKAKGVINRVQKDMETSAKDSEMKAKEYEAKIKRAEQRATLLKEKQTEIVKTLGKDAVANDEYIQNDLERLKVLSEGSRTKNLYEQQNAFVSKYGTRAIELKKFSQKLDRLEVGLDNKVLDFKLSIDMLKDEAESARKMREATTAAHEAMGGANDWQLDFALDVVTSTIAEDLAITAGKMNRLDELAAGNFDLSPDEMYEELKAISENFEKGTVQTKSAKEMLRPDYVLTQEDRDNSGFGNRMF